MAVIEIAKIQVRRGTEYPNGVPQLAPGEFGWAQDTENLYIGKRIVEGANTDENSRILTQKDYDNLFAIAMGAGASAVASTSTYRYRDNIEFALFQSTTTSIAKKLDAFVSLTDFGVTASSTATDIYVKLNNAVQNLFSNIYLHGDARRQLLIPAGNYYLSDTVNLPPYTTLVGEGPGMTNILALDNTKPLFRTVDANGINFSNVAMAKANNVSIENMTLAYTTSTSTLSSLVFFDNTDNSKIENVEFSIVQIVNASTGTVLLSSSTVYGAALSLRGHRKSGIEQNKNTSISKCIFKNVGVGILSTGSVSYTRIDDNRFTNLEQGIKFLEFDGLSYRPAPTNATITKNYFDYITYQGLYISSSTDQTTLVPNPLSHNSSFNNFYYVGNGPNSGKGDGITSNTGTAVITCLGESLNSVGDKFSRKEYANPNIITTATNFFYRPLFEGKVSAESGSLFQVSNLSVGTSIIDRLYVGENTIGYKIPYTLCDKDNNYSRSGVLSITLAGNPDYASPAQGSISDYFDFSYESTWNLNVPANQDLESSIIQPSFNLVNGANDSYLYLTHLWPLITINVASTLVGSVSGVSNASPAVVTMSAPHGLSTGAQIILQGVTGFDNFFGPSGYVDYYVEVTGPSTLALYWDAARTAPLDTVGKPPYISGGTVRLPSTALPLEMKYQVNIIS